MTLWPIGMQVIPKIKPQIVRFHLKLLGAKRHNRYVVCIIVLVQGKQIRSWRRQRSSILRCQVITECPTIPVRSRQKEWCSCPVRKILRRRINKPRYLVHMQYLQPSLRRGPNKRRIRHYLRHPAVIDHGDGDLSETARLVVCAHLAHHVRRYGGLRLSLIIGIQASSLQRIGSEVLQSDYICWHWSSPGAPAKIRE